MTLITCERFWPISALHVFIFAVEPTMKCANNACRQMLVVSSVKQSLSLQVLENVVRVKDSLNGKDL